MDALRAERLAADLNARFGRDVAEAVSDLAAAMARAAGLIQCTSVDMAAHPGLPLDEVLIEPRHWVTDIVYFLLETALLAVARVKGCPGTAWRSAKQRRRSGCSPASSRTPLA